jgi:hypothetical protein
VAIAWIRVVGIAILALVARATAQDLEPRAYSASPVGLNFFLVGGGWSSGSVLVDPNLQIQDVHATLYAGTVGMGMTFNLAGRQALVTGLLPYIWGHVSGRVAEQRARVHRSGLADLRLRLAVNLYGNPARSRREFARFRKRSLIIGTSLTVSAPSGQYDPAKLVNIGTNRWSIKPELGISYPVKGFDLDAYCGVWLFTANHNFFPGGRNRAQDPVTTVQGHASYTLRPRLWLAADITWYHGGATSVNGISSSPENNSRAGVTLSLPIDSHQSVKIAYSTGTTSRIGTDFDTFGVVWQFAWFDRGRR